MSTEPRFTVSGAHDGKVYATNVDRSTALEWIKGYPPFDPFALDSLEVGQEYRTHADARGMRIVRIRGNQ